MRKGFLRRRCERFHCCRCFLRLCTWCASSVSSTLTALRTSVQIDYGIGLTSVDSHNITNQPMGTGAELGTDGRGNENSLPSSTTFTTLDINTLHGMMQMATIPNGHITTQSIVVALDGSLPVVTSEANT